MAEEQTTITSNGNYIGDLAKNLLINNKPLDETIYPGAVDMPLDNAWIKQSFLVSTDNSGKPMLSSEALFARQVSSAFLKYTDSSIGGNTYINSPPQYTPYADIRQPSLNYRTPVEGSELEAIGVSDEDYVSVDLKQVNSYGQGHYWSEAIDDNAQVIHMRFGVPSFNSMSQFFTGFYDSGMATAARTARLSDDLVNKFLAGTGTLIGLAIAPLFIVPMAFTLIAKTARFLANTPATKFYYSKPAMPIYWTAVTNMVNQIAVNAGLINTIDTRQAQVAMKGYEDPVFAGTGMIGQMGVVSHYLPKEVLSRDGKTIDVKKIACRAKMLEVKFFDALTSVLENADPEARFDDKLREALRLTRNNINFDLNHRGLEDYLQKHYESSVFGRAPAASSTADKTTGGPSTNGSDEMDFRAALDRDTESGNFLEDITGYVKEVVDYTVANLADGSDWVSFRVDSTGPVSESFSNSVTTSSIADKINSMSATSRDIRFSVADGNILPGMGAIIDGAKAVVGGVADVLNIDGIAALAGSAFVDIPKHWESSQANLPRSNYSFTLVSPYGNPVSILLNIWIPLSMILAGALPLATGAQSHTSPFLCELYDRGRQMTRLGMIDSLSITRGVSHRGFNSNGHALSIEVNFTVLDLSSVMAMPVMPGFSPLHPFRGIADTDNSFTDYLLTIAGTQLADAIYRFPILRYQLNKRIEDYKSMLSAANMGQSIASLPGVNLLQAVMRGTSMK